MALLSIPGPDGAVYSCERLAIPPGCSWIFSRDYGERESREDARIAFSGGLLPAYRGIVSHTEGMRIGEHKAGFLVTRTEDATSYVAVVDHGKNERRVWILVTRDGPVPGVQRGPCADCKRPPAHEWGGGGVRVFFDWARKLDLCDECRDARLRADYGIATEKHGAKAKCTGGCGDYRFEKR